MTFLEKIRPHLVSDDILVQETVLHALNEYPNVPEEWTVELLKEALRNKEKQSSILIYIENQVINEEGLLVLLEIISTMDKSSRHIALRLLENIKPQLAFTYKNDLSKYLSEDMFTLYSLLQNGEKDHVLTEYRNTLKLLENENPYKTNLLFNAKMLAEKIVEKEWITETEISSILNRELNEDWVSFEGIFTIYMIGLYKFEAFIPVITKLLSRDEDTLLEYVANALIQFQSDKVIKEVAPYLLDEDTVILASSVAAAIKTDYAVEALRGAYQETEEIASQDLLIEALCHQLSTKALPEISGHMKHEYHSSLVDIEQVVYGFYKIVGEDHPQLDDWKHLALYGEMDDQESEETKLPIKVENKVGRNDPCPCESGKKYKKCCG
ncbi:hypothetical protein JOC85_002958 [Bacillus mesophilus]|uniref:Zinc chelation protein SecC n=1 Tax=Bacillus mesophilus TaxID=1808955 RepID=A0A6M0Q888_9BACI|nr:SEC-C metal-binding domain-containing protein [Bacillus mesophilus]MBM7662151.1 hypothetical protein [Bacillus mesophilus]NEY72497.1 zinc chelation protein SecC [Bacillus mesophilus]